MKKMIILAAAALALSGAAANAQTASGTAPATKPAATAPAATTKTTKERTPESIKCSAEADAKNLHGAERKKFRDKCIKDAKKAAKAAKPN